MFIILEIYQINIKIKNPLTVLDFASKVIVRCSGDFFHTSQSQWLNEKPFSERPKLHNTIVFVSWRVRHSVGKS